MKKYIAEKEQTLKDFTDEHYAQGSFAYARLLRSRDVRVNGERCGSNRTLHAGDEVVYYTTPKEESRPVCTTLFCDENVLVADKFSGVNAEALYAYLREERSDLRFIHRLDRNTCGVMVFARNDTAEAELLSAFREHRVDKRYQALCFHPFSRSRADLTAYLKKDEAHARVAVYEKPCPGAEKITTSYEVKQNHGEYSLVEVQLHSGKTHQIRAHLAFIGNPVAGDEKYGDEALNQKYHVKRHILVAKSLCFTGLNHLSYLNGICFSSSFCAELPHRP